MSEELVFSSKNEAIQHLADLTKKRIKIGSVDSDFIDAYIKAMLFSSNDESDESGGEPLDKNYNRSDISQEFMEKIEADCKKFIEANSEFIAKDVERAGGDFWFTRNGHGAGFWDGDWEFEINGENAGEYLTKASEKFGEVNPYVGDDDKIYGDQ